MQKQTEWIRPEEIERRSMEIIEKEMPEGKWTLGERLVVKRCIHASADFDYASHLYFSPGAVQRALEILKSGASLVTDTNMAAAGINKRALGRLGGTLHCFMADEDVAREARERGITRAAVSMERAAKLTEPVIFVIGNAPTALIWLYDMIQAGQVSPAFIIAVPVGFVNVVESKERIKQTDVPCIVAEGRKGGSNIAAAICNALMYQITEN